MNFQTLQSELDDLAGLDLTSTERDRLLNEGYVELCVRSGWTRKTTVISTTTGTELYAAPDLHQIVWVSVGGFPYDEGDDQMAQELAQGTLALRSNGIYFLTYDASFNEKLQIYPPPTANGVPIQIQHIVAPAALVNAGDVPVTPSFSHRAIVDYAAAQAYGLDEDNAELMGVFLSDFERRVDALRNLRLGRAAQLPQELAPTPPPEQQS